MAQDHLLLYGSPLAEARTAVVLVHGRGATAQSMLGLADELVDPVRKTAFLAPQAPGNTWYPYRFMAPIQQNEPYLSRALGVLAGIFEHLEEAGLAPERTLLVGFSQGACLALEYAARNPRRYGGVAGLSGGLIGPPGGLLAHAGSLDSTPVFLGCSDVDPHIPEERVIESAQVLQEMGAQVTSRLYPGMGHTINDDELNTLREMLQAI